MDYEIRPIGRVESALRTRMEAPRQADEGAPEAWLAIDERFAEAVDGLAVGDSIVVLTWLDRADRNVLRTHPRDDHIRPERGVFATRSPDRPNPVGLHEVTIVEVQGSRLRVDHLEALDGTPVIDIKPVLGPAAER